MMVKVGPLAGDMSAWFGQWFSSPLARGQDPGPTTYPGTGVAALGKGVPCSEQQPLTTASAKDVGTHAQHVSTSPSRFIVTALHAACQRRKGGGACD